MNWLHAIPYPNISPVFFELISFWLYPIVMVKFFAGLGVFTLVWMYYYIHQERDLDFIYGIIYSYFAFFFLNWVQPWAFLTVRNDRWLTR